MNTRPLHRLTGLNPRPAAVGRVAFSLIEVLVVIALLSLIIIGLVAMFSQTQRAYRLGTAQVDVLEAGRAVTDMMTRELAQMSPAYQPKLSVVCTTNCAIQLHAPPPVFQELPGSPLPGRTNLLEDFFFLTQENQRWSGIGYKVLDPATGQWPQGGIGTLYRYETNGYFRQPTWQLCYGYAAARSTNLTRLLDGVVHLTIHAFDTNGVWINQSLGPNIAVTWPSTVPDEPYNSGFFSNAVPASVEIELGILEERSIERARSITDVNARSNFVAQLAGKVHIFRWRVPVRNVDPVAYQ